MAKNPVKGDIGQPNKNNPNPPKTRVRVTTRVTTSRKRSASANRANSTRLKERQRGELIEKLEQRIHQMRLARVDKPVKLGKARAIEAPAQQQKADPHAVLRYLRSPAYNKAFAGGHQSSGVVPLPAMSAGKQPRAYMPCRGSTSTVFSIPAGSNVVVAINPYAQRPMIAAQDLAKMYFVGLNVFADYAVWADGGGPITAIGSEWIGGTDPRKMISGFDGPYYNEFDPSLPSDDIILQQFMGGAVNCTVTAGWDTTGRVGVLDGKSYPSFYGTKTVPTNSRGQTASGLIAAWANLPDPEDCFQWFEPSNDFSLRAPSAALSTIQNSSIVGGSETSSAHVSFNLVPEGTRWAPWMGNYNVDPTLNSNCTVGGVPARNWLAMVAAGYQMIIISNDGAAGASPVTVRLNGQFYYNVHIPTHGSRAVPVLAAQAPVTRPHPADATQVHSVPMISHDSPSHAMLLQTQASLEASRNSGMDDAHLYVTHPPVVRPSISSKAVGAADIGAGNVDIKSVVGGLLKNVAPKQILEAVEKPETLLSKLNPEKILKNPSEILDGIASIF